MFLVQLKVIKWRLTLERRAMYYTVYCEVGERSKVWDRLQKEKQVSPQNREDGTSTMQSLN